MIDRNLPYEGSEASSEDGVECSWKDEEELSIMASRKHKIALTAGICGIVILVATVSVVAGMMGISSSDPNATEASALFDFRDVGPDISRLVNPSPTPSLSTTTNIEFISATQSPTHKPTRSPSPRPTSSPTDTPSSAPIPSPSSAPIPSPSSAPIPSPSSAPIPSPSFAPIPSPSAAPIPSPSAAPIPSPSAAPIPSPSVAPITPTWAPVPTPDPTRKPVTNAPVTPMDLTSSTLLTFCVIADVPYYDDERVLLPTQLATQMEGCEFLVHLGDIKRGEAGCEEEYYTTIKGIMLESKVPAFIVPGDNEWNDCGNQHEREDAWSLWSTHLMRLENNWNHTLDVIRQPAYEENFYLIRKRTLIFGLNIVGGRVHDADEWNLRLSREVDWVLQIIIMNFQQNNNVDGIIIMAHAKPSKNNRIFFNPLRNFIHSKLKNEIPVMYLHGDGHSFVHAPNFYNQPNFLRIQHEGGVRDPVLKILADPQKLGPQVYDAFQYDQQLHLE